MLILVGWTGRYKARPSGQWKWTFEVGRAGLHGLDWLPNSDSNKARRHELFNDITFRHRHRHSTPYSDKFRHVADTVPTRPDMTWHDRNHDRVNLRIPKIFVLTLSLSSSLMFCRRHFRCPCYHCRCQCRHCYQCWNCHHCCCNCRCCCGRRCPHCLCLNIKLLESYWPFYRFR